MAGERGNLLLRAADRYLGIPLVRLAGLCRRKTRPPARMARVGALCLGCIGDMILFSGPLADLLRQHPEARLTIFCSSANQDAARMVPGAAEVVVLPVKQPLKAASLVRASGRFDAWLDSGQWPRLGAMLSFAAQAGHKVGFQSPGQHRHHVYDAVAEHSRLRHELDNFRQLTSLLGIRAESLPRLAPLPEAEAGLPGGRLADAPYAVLHLFPGGFRSHMKEWPLDRWAEVARGLSQRGLRVLLSGGPADRPGNQALLRLTAGLGVRGVEDFSGVRVGPTALLLSRAAVVVSVNTGIMHLAAAMDAPLASLNGAVSVERWGPVTRPGRGVALRSPLACAPCLHLGFEYACEDNACMREITVPMVLEAVAELLGQSPAAQTHGPEAV